MYRIALKMLFKDKVKFLTLIIGVGFAVFLITQQGSIFCGLMLRAGINVFETNVPIWVMDKEVEASTSAVRISDYHLNEVRSIDGVEWATPMSMALLTAKSDKGETTYVYVIGIDDNSLIGLPQKLAEGSYDTIDNPDSIIITRARQDFIAKDLKLGDYFEINDNRVQIGGVVNVDRNFIPNNSVFMTYSRANAIAPPSQKHLTYILVSPKKGVSVAGLTKRINQQTNLKALSQIEFFWSTLQYWMKNTGIPINFGITIFLGIIIGGAICGQTLYTFVFENIRQFGTFKAIGINNKTLIGMVLLQSVTVALIGYGLGIGAAALMGLAIPPNSNLAFYTPIELLYIVFTVIFSLCIIASIISIQKVLRVEPAIVFRG